MAKFYQRELADENTAGHGTTGMAKFYQRELADVLQSAPRVAP